MEYRKELLFYIKAQKEKIPRKLGKAINIFFRQSRMSRHVLSYLGCELEYMLKKLKDHFGLFYLRHEHLKKELDTSPSVFGKRWLPFTRIYVFQMHKLDWYEQNRETCLYNMDAIDARKEVIDMENHTGLRQNYGYDLGLYELQLFIATTDTTVVDRKSILRFITNIICELKDKYPASELFDTMKLVESKLNLLSSFLRYKFTVETHLAMKIY